MVKAAFKSLLGRKVRLLMSTFAIVLGVAFVGGSLIFSDTLGRSFTAIFASTVGDVVVSPADSGDGRTASTVGIPASVVQQLEDDVPDAARVDGRIRAFGVYVVDKDNKVVGGQGPPAIGGNYSDAPAGHGLTGLTLTQGRAPHGPDEVVFDAKTAERSGYYLGEKVHIVTSSDQALITPKLVGILDFPEGGSLNGATYAAFDTATAQSLFLGGKDEFSDIWVTADGVSQTQLRDEVQDALPEGYDAVTGDKAADDAASDLLEAISFLRTFLLIFAGISLVVGGFLIVNTFSILVAQRSRELALLRALGASKRQVTRSVLLEALVVGIVGSTLGLGLGVLLAMGIRALFANFGLDLTGQPLIFAPRTALACYVVGVLVTMAAAWLPARRTTRISPVQALRDDIALPGVLDPPAAAARGRRDRRRRDGHGAGPVRGRPARRLGARPGHPRGAARGDGRQPRDQPAVPGARAGGVPAGLRHGRQPRRPQLAAPPTADDRDRLGADDRPRPGVHRWRSSATPPRPASTWPSRTTSSATTS